MDVVASFKYFWQDDKWSRKLIIGSILVLLIIGIPIFLGWYVETTRRAINNNGKVPDWSSIGQYLIEGFQFLLLTILIYVPAQILGGFLVLAFGAFAPSSDTFESQAIVIAMLLFCLMPMMLLVQIYVYAMHAVVLGILADTGSFFKAINPITIFKLLEANFIEIALTSSLVGMGRNFMTSFGTYLCFIGIGPAVIYGYSVSGNLFGQLYLRTKEKLELAEQTAA